MLGLQRERIHIQINIYIYIYCIIQYNKIRCGVLPGSMTQNPAKEGKK